eukprot:10686698-Karenia_brevis.AAC.1
MVCNSVIASALPQWALPQQRGFINTRMMIDNIIEMDTASRIASKTQEARAALIFFDFAAAFPSIAWDYMWLTLDYVGIPKKILQAIQALYCNNRHFFRFMGRTYAAHISSCGVKQGCPLS